MAEISDDLLKTLKLSIGNLMDDGSLDSYYKAQLDIAYADLLSEDISEEVLQTAIGHTTQILYAQALINKQEIATNPTILSLKIKLSTMTKARRYAEDKCD